MAIFNDYTVQKSVSPIASVTSITNNLTTNQECRGNYIGVGADYEIYVDGAWTLFKNLSDGAIYPIRATGIRHTDDSAPDAGDCLFLY